jgi:hypothetical protein
MLRLFLNLWQSRDLPLTCGAFAFSLFVQTHYYLSPFLTPVIINHSPYPTIEVNVHYPQFGFGSLNSGLIF